MSKTQNKWINIRFPRDKYIEFKEIAEKEGKAVYQVILDMISKCSESPEVKTSLDPVDFQKAAWYSFKLVTSITILKELIRNGGDEKKIANQLDRTLRVVKQIKERYGVKTETLEEVIKQYVSDRDKDTMLLLNELTTATIMSIFMRITGLEVKA